MPVTLRRAVDADRAGICHVHVSAIRETCSRSYSAEQIAAWSGLLSPDVYADIVRTRWVLVANEGSRIVGFGQLDASVGEVEAVYVLPDHQGCGTGRMLLALEQRAAERGIKVLQLSATLNAAGFYRHAGYTAVGEVVHRLPTGIELGCIRMTKRLGSRVAAQ